MLAESEAYGGQVVIKLTEPHSGIKLQIYEFDRASKTVLCINPDCNQSDLVREKMVEGDLSEFSVYDPDHPQPKVASLKRQHH